MERNAGGDRKDDRRPGQIRQGQVEDIGFRPCLRSDGASTAAAIGTMVRTPACSTRTATIPGRTRTPTSASGPLHHWHGNMSKSDVGRLRASVQYGDDKGI